jgi:site-specific DNA-methyltransferase (adenine-specific)
MNQNTNQKANTVIVGDAATKLAEIATDSVDCVITSPPYFRLRNYGEKKQIGLEDHVDKWVNQLRQVFTEVARTLKPTGSVWLNLGDSYSRHPSAGAPPKSLLLAPERLLIALAADGWIVRNKVIWAKTNPMPASVRDRLAATHEYLYLLTRSRDYFFDLDAIRIPHTSTKKTPADTTADYPPIDSAPPTWAGPLAGNNTGLSRLKRDGRVGHRLGKNPGDVWTMPTASFHGAHFATFPQRLVLRPLLASCPERTCTGCGQPWTRNPLRTLGHLAVAGRLAPRCDCGSGWKPGLVLDPFFGAGTVALVAEQHRRRWLGIELNPKFRDLAMNRIDEVHTERARGPADTGQKRAA